MRLFGPENGLLNTTAFPKTIHIEAVILAAGKGTRMRELTNELPKPMLKVQAKPILEHIVEASWRAGIREVFIVTGFRADVF